MGAAGESRPAESSLEPADVPPLLLDATFDQLRTLLVVREAGSALRAARVLEREQSSVQKQLDTLNRSFERLCGELLVVRTGRGKDFLFTPTGEAVVELARKTLASWTDGIHASRRRLGSLLTVGTTEFMLPFLAAAKERIADQFGERGIELRMVHIRTHEFWTRLEANEVDLVCGSVLTQVGGNTHLEHYDVIERYRSSLVLLTNLAEHELRGALIGADRLAAVPLVLPSAGLVVDFLTRWYGPDYRSRLRVVADIDDIYYGLSLLNSGLVAGCMLVTEGIGQAVLDGRIADGTGLRVIGLGAGFEPKLELVTGAFARKGDRSRYDADHPLVLLWEAFKAEVQASSVSAM